MAEVQDSGVQTSNNPTMRIILFLTFLTVVYFLLKLLSLLWVILWCITVKKGGRTSEMSLCFLFCQSSVYSQCDHYQIYKA